MKRAVIAGITTIEHSTMMTEETMNLMIERETYYVPTVTAGKSVIVSSDSQILSIHYYSESLGDPMIQDTFSNAYQRGIKITFGTDVGVFTHGKNAKELISMVEAGMIPAQILGMAD